MKRYYRKNRSSVALFLVSNLLAAGSSVFMSFLLGTFADSAMEGDLSRVWKIALVTLFYLCIETFFAFLLDYSRDIVAQRVGRHESFGEIDHFPGRIRQEGETFLEQRKIVRFQVEYFGFGQFVGRQIVLKIEGDTVTEASRPHAGR